MVRNMFVALALTFVAAVVSGIAVRARARPVAFSTDPKVTPINLNVATAADLEKLPGVGPAMAARIIEYRQKNGGFKKVEDLMNVKGIAEKTFLKLKPLVTVTPPKSAER